MSKLPTIDHYLHGNQNLLVIHGKEEKDTWVPASSLLIEMISNNSSSVATKKPSRFHRVSYYVVPSPNGIYNVGKLNDFMDGLVPMYDPTDRTPFRRSEGVLKCGTLLYETALPETSDSSTLTHKL